MKTSATWPVWPTCLTACSAPSACTGLPSCRSSSRAVSRRLCHPRRHGHPDLAQSQGKAGDPAHASLYGVRSQTPRVSAAGGRVLPRKPRPYHVPADVGRLGRRASHGAPHALDHHPRRIHPVRHGIAPVPRPHPAQRGHALLGTHMDVSQKGRDRACCRVHPDLGEHDLPDAGS